MIVWKMPDTSGWRLDDQTQSKGDLATAWAVGFRRGGARAAPRGPPPRGCRARGPASGPAPGVRGERDGRVRGEGRPRPRDRRAAGQVRPDGGPTGRLVLLPSRRPRERHAAEPSGQEHGESVRVR